MTMKLYQRIASLIDARKRCNPEWQAKHTEELKRIERNCLPSGSGVDNGATIDPDSNGKKIVFHTSFHHVNQDGFYDGWTEHKIIITPSFDGFDIRVTGRDRNDIKDYLGDIFYNCLTEEYSETYDKLCETIGE